MVTAADLEEALRDAELAKGVLEQLRDERRAADATEKRAIDSRISDVSSELQRALQIIKSYRR